MCHQGTEEDKAKASRSIAILLDLFATDLETDYLFGDAPGVADFYLFVMLLWARRFGVPVPKPLEALRVRIATRPAVRAAMEHEGLFQSLRDASRPDAG
jgi:glutathione S-transferase